MGIGADGRVSVDRLRDPWSHLTTYRVAVDRDPRRATLGTYGNAHMRLTRLELLDLVNQAMVVLYPNDEPERTTMTPTQIAQVCHEANRALQKIQADETIPVSPPWEELDEETRESAIAGVRKALTGATPAEMYDEWVRFKVEHGWTPGPVKDERTKQHPLLVPYGDLPDSQRLKDDLFLAICGALGR